MSLVLIVIHIIIFFLIFFTTLGWYLCLKGKKYYKKEKPRSSFEIKLEKIEDRLGKIKEKN